MTENQRTIDRYMDGFRAGDHARILACLADDVEWVIPGAFHAKGKDAFDRQIEHEDFVGRPDITVTRTVEQNDTVIAEGSVRSRRRSGGELHAVFCDVFEMHQARIRRLTTYIMILA